MTGNRLDFTTCYFCGGAAATKLIMTQEKILRKVYLNVSYHDARFPVCEKCSETWDKGILEVQANYASQAQSLFDRMVTNGKKGALNAGEEKPQ